MPSDQPTYEQVPATSYLEYAFLRWVLTPATRAEIVPRILPQREVAVAGRTYRLDFAIEGSHLRLAVELDGFEFHGSRAAFSYDRLRQNDLQAAGWTVLRFSYDSIRRETERCVLQLQAVLALDPDLVGLIIHDAAIEQPDMNPDPLTALALAPGAPRTPEAYFSVYGSRLNLKTLRACQTEAFAALANYYRSGGTRAACVMSVGAGKTALGVVASLAFTRRRALVITPGSVIRGTFDRAFDHQAVGNVLYGLPGGPLIPGCPPPQVRTLDRDAGPIRGVTRDELLRADILITNFHSLGNGEDPDDLLTKLAPEDIDFIVVDEAHIAAAESYQRTFQLTPTSSTAIA